jgi:hypothetical protein
MGLTGSGYGPLTVFYYQDNGPSGPTEDGKFD